jgi:type VI protein secretion system component VasK
MLFLIALAVVMLVTILYVAERVRRTAAARHRREKAHERLQAVIEATENKLERDRQKKEQAAALTSVVPAIRDHKPRRVA